MLEAQRRIKETLDESSGVLNLSRLGLTTVPEDLRGLNFTAVDLSGNQITDLPNWLGELPGLVGLSLDGNRLTQVPEVISSLTGLTQLTLSANQLTQLPAWISNLVHLTRLHLAANQLTELPAWISDLTHLTELDVSGNQLRRLPGSMASLSQIHLWNNQLIEVPTWIGDLTQLTRLDLSGNQLRRLPDSIANLIGLTQLHLGANQLTELPNGISNLTGLTNLNLSGNQLTHLPEAISNLTRLTQLHLAANQLTEVPAWIGDLTELTNLNLSVNQLTHLPEAISNLTRLTQLHLTSNQLTELPAWIGDLTELTDLNLSVNQLTHLPEAISNLTRLTQLHLTSNQLTDVPNPMPPSIRVLGVDNNPLPPEMAAERDAGDAELLALLRLLQADGQLIRQVKLILVGGGATGKSSLLAALRGEPWEPNRSATHGIQVKTLELPHDDGPITFNAWDFGGQDIYRPTHQLFFTAPAVYLVLWHPRLGAQQSTVERWIQLIEDRVGRSARVHIVASHGGSREPASRLDLTSLREAFGDMIAGVHEVDSQTRQGLADLRDSLGRTAADIPHMQRRLPRSWLNLQSTLSELNEPYLDYSRYLAQAEAHGLTERSAQSLATNATAVGRWCFYPDQEGLDNLVVLKGDWLSTAMSHVLNDQAPILANGLVTHRRLQELWSNPPVGTGYGRRLHRVFLQLMEKYRLSYQVNTVGGEPTSLVAQLVRSDQPDLSAWHDFGEGLPEHTYVCQIESEERGQPVGRIPEGLIFQLIVQFHKFSMGRDRYDESLHWTGGMVLDDPRHGRALILVRAGAIHVTVKSEFFSSYLLQRFTEDICHAVEESWSGLRVRLRVPCPTGRNSNNPCDGAFDQEMLRQWHRAGRTEAPCNICSNWHDVASLLTLQQRPSPTTADQLTQLSTEIKQMSTSISSIDHSVIHALAQQEKHLYLLLHTFDDQAAHGPRLFTIDPVERGLRNPQIRYARIRLRLWCEHARLPLHIIRTDQPDAGIYDLDVPREWLVKTAPWIRRAATVLRTFLPIATAGLQLEKALWHDIGDQLTLSEMSLSEITENPQAAADLSAANAPPERSGEEPGSGQLRLLHSYLREQDPTFAGLEKVRDAHYAIRWVDPRFRDEYVIPAPRMPSD